MRKLFFSISVVLCCKTGLNALKQSEQLRRSINKWVIYSVFSVFLKFHSKTVSFKWKYYLKLVLKHCQGHLYWWLRKLLGNFELLIYLFILSISMFPFYPLLLLFSLCSLWNKCAIYWETECYKKKVGTHSVYSDLTPMPCIHTHMHDQPTHTYTPTHIETCVDNEVPAQDKDSDLSRYTSYTNFKAKKKAETLCRHTYCETEHFWWYELSSGL